MLPVYTLSQLRPDSKVAIVGENLSGKSTLLKHIRAPNCFDESRHIPLLRGEDGIFVAAAVHVLQYWDVDTQLDPDVVFVFAPILHEKQTLQVFAGTVSVEKLRVYFSALQPYECIVIDFNEHAAKRPFLFVYKAPSSEI